MIPMYSDIIVGVKNAPIMMVDDGRVYNKFFDFKRLCNSSCG